MTAAKKGSAAASRRRRPTTDRGRLEQLRDRLQEIVNNPETSARDVVSASREYRIVVAALAQTAAPTARSASKVDEIAARRRLRGAS